MSFNQLLSELVPILIATGSLLWSFSRQVTRIEAKLQALELQSAEQSKHIETNRQGRTEIFGVINSTLKPRDQEIAERLARVEEKLNTSNFPVELYSRIAQIEAQIIQKND